MTWPSSDGEIVFNFGESRASALPLRDLLPVLHSGRPTRDWLLGGRTPRLARGPGNYRFRRLVRILDSQPEGLKCAETGPSAAVPIMQCAKLPNERYRSACALSPE